VAIVSSNALTSRNRHRPNSPLRAGLLFLGGCLLGVPLYYPTRFGTVSIPGAVAGLLFVAAGRSPRMRRQVASVVRRDPLGWLLVLFAVWVLILGASAVLRNADLAQVSIFSNLKTLYVLAFAWVGLLLAGGWDSRMRYVLSGFKWVNIPIVGVILVKFLGDQLLRGWDPMTARVAIAQELPYLGWPGNYPGLLAACFAISVCDAFAGRGRGWWLELLMAPWILLAILLSLSRTGWLVSATTMAVLLVAVGAAHRWRSPASRRALLVVGLSVTFVTLVTLFVGALPQLRTEAEDRAWDYEARIAAYGVPNERLIYWRDALSILRPFAGTEGIGINYIVPGSGQLHSEYVDLVFRYGLVGLVLMLPAVVLQGVRSFRLAVLSMREAKRGPRRVHLVTVALLTWGGLMFGIVQELIREPLYGPLFMLLAGFTIGTRAAIECGSDGGYVDTARVSA
jgi:hypothetical protein